MTKRITDKRYHCAAESRACSESVIAWIPKQQRWLEICCYNRVWCPPAAPDVRYRQDTLLAATFAPGGSNNEIFAVAGDGQLLFWNGGRATVARRPIVISEAETGNLQHIVQPGFASFSPDGQWLVHYSADARFGCKCGTC